MNNDVIVKKYARAILDRADSNEFYENLLKISPAFTMDKFKMILESYQIKKDEKFNFIFSFFEDSKPYFKNFIKLLAQNSRLNLIPEIVSELEKQKAFKENVYFGIIYSQEPIDKGQITLLEEKLSKKFNAKIKLENQVKKTQGIKISLDELGYELSFSMQSLKSKISDYILKTI